MILLLIWKNDQFENFEMCKLVLSCAMPMECFVYHSSVHRNVNRVSS